MPGKKYPQSSAMKNQAKRKGRTDMPSQRTKDLMEKRRAKAAMRREK